MLACMGTLLGHLRVAIFALLVVGLSEFVAAQRTQTYTSSQHGFSIDFPADWQRVPDADVKKGENTVHAASSSAASVIWEAVFQAPGGSHSFEYPYVILQVVPYSVGRQLRDSEIEQAVNQMTGDNVKKSMGSTGNKVIDDAFSGANFGTAQYDSTNRIVYQSIDMNAPGVGPIKGLTVSHFGRNSIVSVMCYDRAGHIGSSKAIFSGINSSFRFEPGSAYDPSQSSALGALFNGTFRGAIIGGLVGITFGALVWLTRRLKGSSR